jgi:hypothetical protein
MAAQVQAIASTSARAVGAPRRRSQLRVSAVAEVERVATNGAARVSLATLSMGATLSCGVGI